MTLAQFTYDPDNEQWWVEPVVVDGLHDPTSGSFVLEVDGAALDELVRTRDRYARLLEELVDAAGLDPTEPALKQTCGSFFSAGRMAYLEQHDRELFDQLRHLELCATCGNPQHVHTSGGER